MNSLLRDHPDYWLFHSMKKRCSNPNHVAYRYYGGRGISVCERWLAPRGQGFKNFLEDMGPRAPGLTLDRKDGDKNYSPENCRWATREEQYSNRSANVFIEFGGEKLTATQWARRIGVRGGDVVLKRIRAGVPLDVALTAKTTRDTSKFLEKAVLVAAQLKLAKPDCKRGHLLVGDNLHISPKGVRICRQCKRETQAAIRAQNKP